MIPDIQNLIVKMFVNGNQPSDDLKVLQSDLQEAITWQNESNLSIEIDEAMCEGDIISLRNQLKNISKQTETTSVKKRIADDEAYFGLSEEIFNPKNLQLETEDPQIGNYLQKLHIKNHSSASKEIVHDLFLDNDLIYEVDNQKFSPEDELLFDNIRDAVTEKEIIELRANLQSISQSVSIHEHSFEEIEDLVNGELDDELETLIRQESLLNTALSNEIDLHCEINSAIEEMDIMNLRAGLRDMMKNEYSHSRSIEEIDDFLNEELDEFTMAQFEEELLSNSGLSADLTFHKELDMAIKENDIMALRSKLKNISLEERSQNSEMRGVAPPRRNKLIWYAAASSIILLIAFSSLLKQKAYSTQQLYSSNYHPYKNGANISRSATNSSNEMNTAIREIDRGNYSSALQLLGNASHDDADGFSINFYSGVAYQELGEYKSAIRSFNEVVKHGDNLLVEQSEWYIGLCFLRIEEREKAINQFRSIVARNGFYRNQSNKLLKQLE